MCESCGCGDTPHNHNQSPDVIAAHARVHAGDNAAGQAHTHGGRTIALGKDVLSANDGFARDNRAAFERRGLFAVNIIGSPGCGKTTLVEALARRFTGAMAVIEGDIQTRRDAERVIGAGSRARQIETGGACHLDAHMVGHALEHLDTEGSRLLVIENVGNLVCPAAWDLGEHEKIAVLSLPEGDDKVLKYPSLFHRANVVVVSKIDLAPHVAFDVQKVLNECRSLNRSFTAFQVSATTGEGMDALCGYLAGKAGISVQVHAAHEVKK